MKCHVSLALLMLATVITIASVFGAPQANCPNVCTAEYQPVCGYTGTCYRQFGNPCTFNAQQCEQQNLIKVDQSQCDQAQSGTDPNVIKC